jgi:hypothetical protein
MTYAEFIEMLTWIMRYNMAIDKLMVPQCVLELLDHAITQGIPFYECPKKQVFSWLDGMLELIRGGLRALCCVSTLP